MRIVVTGASGFLGRRLARRLKADGRDALLVSRRVLDAPGALCVSHYAETPPGDILVHLAESADRFAAEGAGEAHGREALATLDALLSKSFSQVVYASSGLVYGDASAESRTESDPTPAPGAYAAAKRACEARVFAAGGACARLANLYGPGQPDGTVVADIFDQVPGTGPLSVRDAMPVRDFLWVDDAVDALVRMFDRGLCGAYNVASGQGLAVGALARLVLEAAGEPDRVIQENAPSGRMSYLVMNPARALDVLGWRPLVSPLVGVAKLLRERSPKIFHARAPVVDGR